MIFKLYSEEHLVSNGTYQEVPQREYLKYRTNFSQGLLAHFKIPLSDMHRQGTQAFLKAER